MGIFDRLIALVDVAVPLSLVDLVVPLVLVAPVVVAILVVVGRALGRHLRDATPDRPVLGQTGERTVRRSKRHLSPTRFDVEELARRLGVESSVLRSATPRYTTWQILKRAGGHRTITAPDSATKAVQRRILHRLLARLPANATAHGFERGRSIVTNARLHADASVLVKLDIQDFFGQTRTARIRRYWRVLGWDRESARILTRLTTHAGGLPQGAPTSPRLANLVNFHLDARLAGIAATHAAQYSRYADDLTFSFADDDGPAVRQLIHTTRRTVWQEGRYLIHVTRKVEIRRRHERQAITGLIVNDGPPRLPRATRRWLRAVEYRRYSGGTPTIDDEALRGWQALEAMIEAQAGIPGARKSLPTTDA